VSNGANWFAQKLGTAPAPAQPTPAPAAQAQARPVQHQQPQTQEPVDPEDDPNAPSVTNLLRNEQHAERASKARKYETDRCPGCGSANYFSRNFIEGGVARRGPAPTPQCFDCGYPTIQYGSAMGEGGMKE
jgi:hypothetical protein